MAVLVPVMDVDSVAVGVVVVADSGRGEVGANVADVVRDALAAVASLDNEEDDDEDAWFADNAPATPPPTAPAMSRIVPMASTQKSRGLSPHIRSRWR